MKTYETIIITTPELPEDDEKVLVDSMVSIVQERDGKLHINDRMGRRRLAYPIRKLEDGVYTRLLYDSGNDAPTEIERRLRLSDKVLRVMTVALEKDWAKDAREAAAQLIIDREEAAKRAVIEAEEAAKKAEEEAAAAAEAAELGTTDEPVDATPEEAPGEQKEAEGDEAKEAAAEAEVPQDGNVPESPAEENPIKRETDGSPEAVTEGEDNHG